MTADRYAARTSVPVHKTRDEIQQMLERHGATKFGYLAQYSEQVIVFEIASRRVMMRLPMPDRDGWEFTRTAGGKTRSILEAERLYEQAVRARWRSLLLIVKAKLTAVTDGITTIEREFLSDILLPNNDTVAQWLTRQIDRVYESGEMPALLPGSGGER